MWGGVVCVGCGVCGCGVGGVWCGGGGWYGEGNRGTVTNSYGTTFEVLKVTVKATCTCIGM